MHHHFELIGWSEPKVITRFLIIGDHLRALQPDDAEAADERPRPSPFVASGSSSSARREAAWPRRSCWCAAARRVTLTDLREQIEDEERLRAAGVALELGGHRRVDVRPTRTSIVLSPGVPPRSAGARARARRAGVPVTGELELASRWLRGRIVAITGTKGKSTTTTLTGRMLEAGGHRVLVGGNIGLALERAGRCLDRRHDSRRRGEQLSARERRDVPAVDRGAAELLARPPRSPRQRRGVRARPRRASSRKQQPTDWAVLNADDPGVARAGAATAARAGCCSRCAPARSTKASRCRGDAIVRRTADGDEPLVPLASVKLLGRHLLADVLAAAAVASIAGVDAAAMTQGRRGIHRARARARAGGRDRRRAVRERLEGHQHRGGAPRDRELRRRRGRRSSAAGSRAATSAICSRRSVERQAHGRRDWRSEAAHSRGARRRRCRCTTPTDMRAAVRTAFASASPGGRRAARAGVLELRHVSRLRRARAGVQAGGAEAAGGVEHDAGAVAVETVRRFGRSEGRRSRSEDASE